MSTTLSKLHRLDGTKGVAAHGHIEIASDDDFSPRCLVQVFSGATDGRVLALGSSHKRPQDHAEYGAYLVDLSCQQVMRRFLGHTDSITSIHTHVDVPHWFCSASRDSTVRLWDTRFKHRTIILENAPGVSVNKAILENVDGIPFCFSVATDGKLRAWDLRMEKILYSAKLSNACPSDLSFNAQ
eukprot:CAMPEP_0201560674 /NCGR_PEP_ID=MMETSP0173_2-20130828/78394_1 /ASSEMBLY_ACC=CAM_ASM_000268 /TAXON_ID=218659 /ORGANISM="Vexillifera sp., Strain DIVA3 564/2" /LENGTH=183 /DNA_ID=CAMNT_0047975133 /DNA_START=598 /DNA_END=1146 /DNA_ORIENTATION=-